MILTAQRANASPSPAITETSRLAGSVEHGGNRLVRHLARQSAHKINNLGVGSPPRLTGAVPLHQQTRVVATLPMNDQLQGIADNVDNDLGYDRTNNLFAGLRSGAGILPSLHQVLAERHEPLAVRLSQGRRFVCVEPIDLEFKIANRNQALVPSMLQLAGDQAILRVGGVILAMRPGGFVAGLL